MKLPIFILTVIAASVCFAQGKPQLNGAGQPIDRGVIVYPANIYLQPDSSTARLANVERGREVVVLERSTGDWVHVLATLQEATEEHDSKDINGWMRNRGIVFANTPDGDRIMFGEAADSEAEASRRGGRKGADRDAIRLYYRTAEYFPQSPLAGEALFRAADDRWQIDRADVMSLPSARERDPNLRSRIHEDLMRQVIKKFPNTRWADMAAFRLIENKLCGDWQAESKCPEKEAEMYEKYVDDHASSPAAPEALYNAAWRRACLVDIYQTENKANKSPDAKAKASALAQRIISQYPQSDYASRARTLLYLLQQGIPIYGSNVD